MPENPAAVAMGAFKAVVSDHFRGRSDLAFDLANQKFQGQMQTIDQSVTTTGRSATTSQTGAVGANNAGIVGAVLGSSQKQTASATTTTQGSSNGVANAVSDKGTTMSCEYVVNNKQLSGTGTCTFSNGAKFRIYAKPLRLFMSDGSSRQI